jgi:chromosome partitioning protein
MIITVAHTKGGVGKSTLAWHLAHAFKELGDKVTIIDLDFQQTLFFINQIRATDTIKVLQPQTVAELFDVFKEFKKDETYIMDIGGFDSDINRTAIELAHTVLVPISDSVTEVLGFKTFENILGEMILGTEIKVVLNNIHPLTRNFDIIKEAVGKNYSLLKTVVRTRKVYKTTLGVGASVFDTNHQIAKEEIRGVRDELIST